MKILILILSFSFAQDLSVEWCDYAREKIFSAYYPQPVRCEDNSPIEDSEVDRCDFEESKIDWVDLMCSDGGGTEFEPAATFCAAELKHCHWQWNKK